MSDDPHAAERTDQLGRELGAPVPEGQLTLAPDDLAALTVAVAAARAHQREALETAGEEGLRLVPRILRGPVRKVLFG